MSYTLYRPESTEEAIRLQMETNGKYLAGGTVSLVNYHKRRDIGEVQISLDRIPELTQIYRENGVLCIGSMVTMDMLEARAEVKKYARALWQAASEVGGPQIRNRATLGGNLAAASPSSDCATPLLALNAELCVQGEKGMRFIPLRDFFLGRMQHVLTPDEIIVSVRIPERTQAASAFRKVGKRNALAVSCINMAVVRSEAQIDIAVGAAAPKPVYCGKTSGLLSQKEPDLIVALQMIQTEISPIDDRWATATYRRTVCGNLLKALLQETEELL